jgi:hypothetical protein
MLPPAHQAFWTQKVRQAVTRVALQQNVVKLVAESAPNQIRPHERYLSHLQREMKRVYRELIQHGLRESTNAGGAS